MASAFLGDKIDPDPSQAELGWGPNDGQICRLRNHAEIFYVGPIFVVMTSNYCTNGQLTTCFWLVSNVFISSVLSI